MRMVRTLMLIAVVALPSVLRAQVGSTTDILIGRVTGPEGTPVAGARVEATSAETEITRIKVTGADGRYTIIFPDGGGNYRLRVVSIGFAPSQLVLARQSDEDRLVGDVRLGRTATVLQSVQVRAAPARQPNQRPEAGSTGRGLPPGLVNRLPIEPGDLNALATLAPGVVGVPETDSTAASFSVGGQPANQNSITLDGLSFGSGSVPQEAVRNTRVVTSTYDVARGQFTGGQIASTTRGGTNIFQGALNYSLRDPSLEFVDEPENAFSQKFTQNQINGGFGGPIVKNKLFTFGAFSLTRRTDALQSLLAADPLALQRLGTNGDSVARFIALLGGYGLQPTTASIPDERLNDNASALVRIDYSLADNHTLMLRGDWRGSVQDASRISPFSVPHSGGNAKSAGGGGMLTLTSNWSGVINELRAYVSGDSRSTDPYLLVPSGRVVVASELPDERLGVSTLQFGVNSALPQESRSRRIEISDEISRVSNGGAHRIKLGGLLNEESSENGSFSNALGTYTFNSLADFDAGIPISYTRTLSSRDRQARSNNAAIYLGDSWRRSQRLQFTYGLRLEGSRYPNAPGYNPLVDSVFGRRTDRFPSELHLSPRAGFTWNYGSNAGGSSRGSIRGGFGEFRGRAPSQLFASAADANGLANGQEHLVCVGAAVPLPDWDAFLNDSRTIPVSCNGPSQQFGARRRNVTIFSDDFSAPRAWRGSLGFNRRFAERYNVSLDASYARGVSQTGARDINLDTTSRFSLIDEGGRPVYSPASAIVPSSGAVSLSGSRIEQRFGVVSEINSGLTSSTRQLTASLNGIAVRSMSFGASYTVTHSRDEVQGLSTFGGGGGGFGGGGSGASTAGNPNVAERGRSDQERRHSMLATVTWPVKPGFELTAIGRVASGAFFTPIVAGDINGDGLRNDRPFMFDPDGSPDATIAAGMSRLLAGAPGRARECILRQLGTIASRSSCTVPWSPSLDIRANFRPSGFGLDRRLTVSLLALNSLTGIDQLLHGDDLRGWGQPVFPDRTLLYVRGFDPVSQRFLYQVNENFGAASGSRNAFRVPFQIAVQARFTLGSDPVRQQLNAGAGGAAGRQTAVEFRARLARAVPNPFTQILELNDSLGLALDTAQKASLQAHGDTLKARADIVLDSLSANLAGSPRSGDPAQAGARMRTRIQEARSLAQAALKDAESILTPGQWAKVPQSVKQPFAQRPDGQEGGRQNRRRPPGA